MQFTNFTHLSEPTGAEQFCAALASVCVDVGMEHYLAVRLGGNRLDDVLQVFENAPEQAGDVKSLRHWSITRLLDRMRDSGPPVVFGHDAEAGLELPGYMSGVGYLVREQRGAAVFFLGCSAASLPVPALPVIQSLMLAAHHGISGMAKLERMDIPLSGQELLCLQHFLNGHSAKVTAELTGVSRKTVEHYLASARKRLGVKTTSAAAYKAFDRGWIKLDGSGGAVVTG